MATSPLSVVIHGHFYQPPREDPWLETVEAQPLAEPFHDWNERITEECYRAVVAARVPGPEGRIAGIVNTLESISFNFGPTLLDWMERRVPKVYRAILDADVRSVALLGGHGNALAQAYHHTILPLASRREKATEVRWGISDFRGRFGRDPEGMWLPETAVDDETLDVLAQEGIAFTILAPHQVTNPPPTGFPGLYKTSRGRSIALFVYNGPLSHGVAFGALLQDADKWARDMVGSEHSHSDHADDDPEAAKGDRPKSTGLAAAGSGESLVSIATDGETYGHHHRFGEMALAAVLEQLHRKPGVRVENFASFLSRNPPRHEVGLVEPSSWSCTHGVERWRADCGCKMKPEEDSQQEWRRHLRDAVEWLAAEIHEIFELECTALLGDPWAARDRYGPGGEAGAGNMDPGPTTHDIRTLELLELERQALRIFTSCAWFFDDLAGVEPIQILRYAARALELAGPGGEILKDEFLEWLDEAVSNESPPRTGREIFLEEVEPKVPAHLRVAGGAALWMAVAQGSTTETWTRDTPGFAVEAIAADLFRVTHRRTGREWEVETEIHRPSAGKGAVAVRARGGTSDFVPLEFADLPEAFRDPIAEVLTGNIPDFSGALCRAVEALRNTGAENGAPLEEHVSRVRDLADLHLMLGLPIPFDAQTLFHEILRQASPELAGRLAELRIPLGFTPGP
jgi:hypothetical protein